MIHATLDFSAHRAHFVTTELTFVANTDAPTLWLPTWIAGSYLVREFAKNISNVTYQVTKSQLVKSHADNGMTHRAPKLDKNHWQLDQIKQGDTVLVRYEVYCYDLSVRTAYVDHKRLFGNLTALLVTITGHDTDPIALTMRVPTSFLLANPNSVVACAISHQEMSTDDGISYVFMPSTVQRWYDCPFEIGVQDYFEFDVMSDTKAIKHRFFLSGHHDTDLDRLKKDLRAICQAHVDMWVWVPFEHYTFMTCATGQDYGGLEHHDSTALIIPRSQLPSCAEGDEPSANYQNYLGLCSHEYFHAWWVKSVRPDVMMTADLQAEAPTPLLWVFEGFTSYIDNFLLYKSGVISVSSYLSLLGDDISRYLNNHGRHHQSVAESSFDAWIKLYRPDENSPNRTTSYYNKGTLVALCLDLLLRKAGHSLMAVIGHYIKLAKSAPNRLYGMSTEHLSALLVEHLGQEAWQTFYARHIIGTDELPLTTLLADFGVRLEVQYEHNKAWGMTTEDSAQGVLIKAIHPDAPAALAGLSAKDVIIAIDGIKATVGQLRAADTHQQHTKRSVTCHTFRRDELMSFDIAYQKASGSDTPDQHDGRQTLKARLTLEPSAPDSWL